MIFDELEKFYSADATVGSSMLNEAKSNFSNKDAKEFLREAALNPHTLPELAELANLLFWDIELFYGMSEKEGIGFLELAKENFRKNVYAKKFLGMAASKPHRLPELKDLAVMGLWDSQKSFFFSLLRNYPKKDYEDLMSAMFEGFITWLPKFDAENYAPGTYFKTRLLNYAYREVIKINEMVPEHKIHNKKMILMQKEALIADGKAVTFDSISQALPDIPIKDIQEILPLLGDDGATLSMDTLGDGGALDDQLCRNSETPEQVVIEQDKQACFAKTLRGVFSIRELNILSVYSTNGRKLLDAKTRLIANFGYTDITEDEIRFIWADAANRVAVFSDKHPEMRDYLGSIVGMYASKIKNSNPVSTETESDIYNQLWDDTVDTIVDIPEYEQLRLFGT